MDDYPSPTGRVNTLLAGERHESLFADRLYCPFGLGYTCHPWKWASLRCADAYNRIYRQHPRIRPDISGQPLTLFSFRWRGCRHRSELSILQFLWPIFTDSLKILTLNFRNQGVSVQPVVDFSVAKFLTAQRIAGRTPNFQARAARFRVSARSVTV